MHAHNWVSILLESKRSEDSMGNATCCYCTYLVYGRRKQYLFCALVFVPWCVLVVLCYDIALLLFLLYLIDTFFKGEESNECLTVSREKEGTWMSPLEVSNSSVSL